MAKSLFPEDMMGSVQGTLTLESIAGKITTFTEQLHLIHWQTSMDAEHRATGAVYEHLEGFKDDIIEKLIGYTGRKPKSYKIDSPADNANSTSVINEVMNFASELKKYGEANNYNDVCNMADDLSGTMAKFKFLLTLS